jgi:hypothetical protein
MDVGLLHHSLCKIEIHAEGFKKILLAHPALL